MIFKTTTKWIAAAAMVILITGQVQAQTTAKRASKDSKDAFRVGLGLEAGYPTKNFSNAELGGTIRLQYDLANNISLILTPGFYHFFAKDGRFQIPENGIAYGNDLNIIPVKAGLKSFFAQNFYLSAEAGAGFELNHAKETKLILSPGIGYAGNKGLDLGLRYENFSGNNSSYGLIGLRIAYGFKL